MEKLILTDVDGVLLSWNNHFSEYMKSLGHRISNHTVYDLAKKYGLTEPQIIDYVGKFNNTDATRTLKPFRDAEVHVKDLSSRGFKFVAITSLGCTDTIIDNRSYNLKSVFGDVFSELHCLPVNSSKENHLKPYRNSGLFWIEDHYHNAESGAKLGLRSILVDAEYNRDKDHKSIVRVNDITPWAEIKEAILKEYSLL